MRTPILLFSALFFLLPSFSRADPLSAEFSKMFARGYSIGEKASASVGKHSRLTAVIYRNEDGSSQRFRLYRAVGGRSELIYLDPSSAAKLTLSSIHGAGSLPDLIGDGSRIIAYSVTFPGTEQQSLVVLRYASGKIKRLGGYPFAEFKDVDLDGRLELVSRARPLGQFFALECESFHSMAQTAFQTRIYSWKGAALAPSSERYPAYFSARIAELEEKLSTQNPRGSDHYGGYLGNALSLYFDYAEIGRGREGWQRFIHSFPVRSTDPARVKRCLREMEDALRKDLRIPDDW